MWRAAAKAAPLFRRPPIRADNHQGLLIKKRLSFLSSKAYSQNHHRRRSEIKARETYKPVSNRLKGRLKTRKHLSDGLNHASSAATSTPCTANYFPDAFNAYARHPLSPKHLNFPPPHQSAL
jgi:hypothetical protein